MTEQELRALVRQAIAYHVGNRQAPAASSARVPVTFHHQHTSHAQFALPAEPGGACVIEPAVTCNHCGFCKSYGH
ncbi:MAG: hypothetical protein ABL986_05585 [Vicinamibacterales bacterium]